MGYIIYQLTPTYYHYIRMYDLAKHAGTRTSSRGFYSVNQNKQWNLNIDISIGKYNVDLERIEIKPGKCVPFLNRPMHKREPAHTKHTVTNFI